MTHLALKTLNRLFLSLSLLSPGYALAQSTGNSGNGNWIEPASELAETLQGGLVQIGGPIIGIGIVVIGLWAGITGRMPWERVGMVVIGGLLITVGPSIMTNLLGT
ncbi:MAG: TrbC/VirB2 family protein [Sneathiella sp.]